MSVMKFGGSCKEKEIYFEGGTNNGLGAVVRKREEWGWHSEVLVEPFTGMVIGSLVGGRNLDLGHVKFDMTVRNTRGDTE